MLHWDDELERRMAPIRAKVEAENRKIAELQSKLVHAEMEALRLGWYLRRMEEENRRLQEMIQAAVMDQAWGGEGLDEVKGIMEQAWLELVLIALPQGRALGALIRSLEALKVWQSPR